MFLHVKLEILFRKLHVGPLKRLTLPARVCVFLCVYLHVHFAKPQDPLAWWHTTHVSLQKSKSFHFCLAACCLCCLFLVWSFLGTLTAKQYISAEQTKRCPEQKELSVIYCRLQLFHGFHLQRHCSLCFHLAAFFDIHSVALLAVQKC